ncbi:glycerol-3-phosphate 1-O-acyltransferase PlsY [Luteolibacter yonseiensis]|uniref:Glycerol-3-phosphate acyltransferase n=1 Tax=Luteolibacter yonseiensis TaxID=1144680 RepID=A0A934R518_9BACT|nr:glycerol-3-phosphate 1-O-acyltransferase PlsY [Luteolibacter yonseiensis]MBK1817301.1 glycerol-3-phosphate 1-O-acyltransferase PlsY [Luteolibacter yonseiensis]
MQLWLCPLIAFLLGSIPFGLLIAKAKGINIREHGSGNIGATNVLRVVGKKYGITCLLLDALKGFIPVLIAINVIRISSHSPLMTFDFPEGWILHIPAAEALKGQIAHILTALAAVLGHNYSPWVGFRGGKGIATSAGVFLALMPAGLGVLIIVFLIVFITTRYVSLASIVAAAALPMVTLWGSWHHGRIQDGTWNKPLFVFTVVIGLLAIWKHRSNIQRLREGTENRFTRKAKSTHV